MLYKILICLLFSICFIKCDTSRQQDPLLSPCVGKSGSPCERFPVNTWLYK